MKIKKINPSNIILIVLILFATMFYFTPLSQSTAKTNNVENNEIQKGHQRRIWHFVLRHVSLQDAKWMVKKAEQYGFNSVVVLITDGVKLENSPWTPLENAWSKEDLRSWIKYVNEHNMEVIPEIKLLTHQEKFLQKNHPSLMYNSFTYNPRLPQVYTDIVFPFLDEIIRVTTPKTIHIGHDEVAGHNKKSTNTWFIKRKWLIKKEKFLPADLFLIDTIKIHNYLKNKDIQTGIWGDMLIASNEFPTMKKIHLHGNNSGYGHQLRQKIPKDIIIFDWHYFGRHKSYPSLKTFQEEGFRVIGSTWKNMKTTKNFSEYAAKHNSYGMLATTWWHVQKKEWEKVDFILKESGNIFLNH